LDKPLIMLRRRSPPAGSTRIAQLFWPYNTEKLDAYIAEKQAEEKARKAALKAQGAGKR